MRSFFTLTKSGIVWFVLLTAAAGFALSLDLSQPFPWRPFGLLMFGLYLVSSGSFAINQAQEWQLDSLMPRTQKRPIPAGQLQPWQANALGVIFIFNGTLVLSLTHPYTALLSLGTVVLYNGLYTIYFKRHWSFGAVPGAIPGAMPAVIGYSASQGVLLSPESFYLFMIMFLWQMPHFWCLAIRYKDDYAKAGVPVLPVQLGVFRTLYHIGIYTIAYLALAVASPWFLKVHALYLILVLPMVIKVLYEYVRYFQARAQARWLPFFLWVNFSMLAFVGAPVVDKWLVSWVQL